MMCILFFASCKSIQSFGKVIKNQLSYWPMGVFFDYCNYGLLIKTVTLISFNRDFTNDYNIPCLYKTEHGFVL